MIDKESEAHEKTEFKGEKDSELLTEARKRFKLSSDYWSENRKAFSDDINFIYLARHTHHDNARHREQEQIQGLA